MTQIEKRKDKLSIPFWFSLKALNRAGSGLW